jgi:hypothetical protein
MNMRCLILVIFSLILFSTLTFSQSVNPAGIWQGKLSVQGTELRIVFKIKDTLGLHATMDSPDQGGSNIPCDTVIVSATGLTIGMKSIGGQYEGTFTNDTSIDGKWSQGGASFPLDLHRTEKIAEVRRPQEPIPPYPYNEEDVSYPNPVAGTTLAGTLTTPKGNGPFPVVLLITGSGPQDRNEALMGHKPFLILSDYLTRRGIAVLRVDDRGVGKSTGKFAGATTKDFSTDVMAGIQFLKTRPEVDPKKIGLIGHSEGGIIAPMLAAESHDVAFIVMMAGTGVTGAEILDAQRALIYKAGGEPEESIKKETALYDKAYAVLASEPDSAVAAGKLNELFHAEMKSNSEKEDKELGLSEDLIPVMIKELDNAWFRYFIAYDPRPALEKVTCPVLAINGEKDMQVPPDLNLPQIEKALKEGGNNHYTIKKLPGLNHLFQTCDTGAPSEYAKIEETMSPLALQTMGDWILEQVK